VGELGVAASGATDHDNTQSLWVGGAKSTLAALGFWVSPLRIGVPPSTGDACTDRAALRAAAERAADDERRAFWASHIGGLIVNAAGAIVLAETASWKTGLLSFASGYPVGLLSTYTMPRASWARVREPAWTASVVAGGQQYALVVAGAFYPEVPPKCRNPAVPCRDSSQRADEVLTTAYGGAVSRDVVAERGTTRGSRPA
jgi:hypothetical protein